MRTITMQTIKDGKQGRDAALMDRLDIVQIEAQMEKDMAGSEQA